jgi:hypothetical protein
MPQTSTGPAHEHERACCRHCSAGIERWPGGFWTHERTRSARCVPGSPLNAQLADPRPDSVVAKP